MRHQSPVPTFGPDASSRRYPHSPHQAQSDQNASTRDQRAASITPVNKFVKVTVHAPATTIKQIIRPVERRVLTKVQQQTVQLYEKPQPDYATKERLDHSVNETTSYLLMQKDMQIEHLQNENSRLIATVHDLHCQIETWRIKYGNLEKDLMTKSDRTPEVETYKALLIENRECFAMEVQSLRYEITHQKQLYSQNEYELQTKLDRQRVQLEENENKLALFTTEIERMNCMLQQKQTFIEQYKIDEKEFKGLATQVKVRDDIIEERNQEIGNLRRQALRVCDLENNVFLCKTENDRLYFMIQQMESELQDQTAHSQRLENHIQTLSNEIQRLNQLLEQQQLQHQSLEMESQELLSTLKERDLYCDELENNLNHLKNLINQKDLQLNSKDELISISKSEQKELKDRINELSNQLNVFAADFQEQVSQKQDILEQLSKKQKELNHLNSQFEESESNLQTLRGEYGIQIGKCQEYAEKLYLLSSDIESLTQKYKLKVRDFEDISNINYEIQQQSEAKDSEISLVLEKCRHLTIEINRLTELEINYYKLEDKCCLLCQEIERLSNLNQQKDYQLNQIQCAYRDLELQFQSLKDLNDKHLSMYQEESSLHNDLRLRTCELERKYQIGADDRQLLSSKLDQAQRQHAISVEEYQKQLSQVLDERSQFHQQTLNLSEQICQLEQTVTLLATENERLNNYVNNRNVRITELESLEQDCQVKLKLAILDNERLSQQQRQQIEIWNQDQDTLLQQISLQNEKINHIDNSLKNKETENLRLEGTITELLKESEELRNQLRVIESDQEKSQSDLETQEQYIVEIKETNTYLSNELDSWKTKFVTLNREFHKTQEDYMMIQAEYDALKQRKIAQKESASYEITRKSTYLSSVSHSILIDKENRKSIAPLSEIN